MKITEHFRTRHKQYAIYDNYRSIANYIDGFKPSSRKIFYCIDDFKKLNKVDTIANSTALKTQYLHGSTNLEGVTVGLAQTFPGTNIFPLFKTEGFFGTRVTPVPGASRYIKAMKNPNLDLLYKPEDLNVLIEQEFEGYKIEPQFYVPILPAILLNTQSGIGNGYSQTIYSRNITELINYIRSWLTEKKLPLLLPYFEGFKGNITQGESVNQYNIEGKLTIVNSTTIEITELPINTSIEKYIKFLNELEDEKVIKDFKDKCNKNIILFEIKVARELTKESIDKLYKIFKLKSTISETLTCIGPENQIVVFNDIYEIIEAYVKIRLEYYTKRKIYIIAQYEKDIIVIDNKIKFIEMVNSGKILVNNKSRNEIELQLSNNYFHKVDDSYDYLLSMRIYNLTLEKHQELLKDSLDLKNELEAYKEKTEKDIWLEELNILSKSLKIKTKEEPEKAQVTKNEKIPIPKMLKIKPKEEEPLSTDILNLF